MYANHRFRVGTAGWGIPREHGHLFSEGASHLERYAKIFNCVEINSSFYRPHRSATYRRWAETTPEHFRFAVKLPKQISHESGLHMDRSLLHKFLDEVRHLDQKLGPLLVQLPPRQAFRDHEALPFLTTLRELHPEGAIVLEPRHRDWFSPAIGPILESLAISRVVADPPPVLEAATPRGGLSLAYYRLHGSPRTYYSSYSSEALAAIGKQMAEHSSAGTAWCIFDNTASGAAVQNAAELNHLLARHN